MRRNPMRDIIVNCAGTKSEDEFWQRYLETVRPDGAVYFGRNLDAFWDAIEGGGPGWPGDVRLIFTGTEALSIRFVTKLWKLAEDASSAHIELLDARLPPATGMARGLRQDWRHSIVAYLRSLSWRG